MKYQIFAIRDRAADVFGVPFMHGNRGSAIRAFGDTINRVGSDDTISKHPEDFDLFALGEFDDADGRYETHVPKQIAIGKDLVVKG